MVEARKTMRFADGSELEVDFIVFSTGIRPRDKLATQCGLDVAPRVFNALHLNNYICKFIKIDRIFPVTYKVIGEYFFFEKMSR